MSRIQSISLALLVCGVVQGRADNGWDEQILSFIWENDATAGSDKHYTQGARISYFSKDDALPGWLNRFSNWLPTLGYEAEARKFGLAVTQEIYTPEDLQTSQLVVDDRPYAGWLYATATLQRRGQTFFDRPLIEDIKLDAGVVGPESLAEQTQKKWHGVDPEGWANQLKTEPGFNLRYDRSLLFRHHFEKTDRLGDVIPFVEASAGNVHTFAGIGTTLRFGFNIPNEFETAHDEEPRKWGAYVFTTLDGRYVIRNIFLDGNTFADSHRVDKRPVVGNLRFGFTFVLKSVELTASHTFLTQEFRGEQGNDSYGAATVTFKF